MVGVFSTTHQATIRERDMEEDMEGDMKMMNAII